MTVAPDAAGSTDEVDEPTEPPVEDKPTRGRRGSRPSGGQPSPSVVLLTPLPGRCPVCQVL